jgi:hypothetical protein
MAQASALPVGELEPDEPLMAGDVALSLEFKAWCRGEMQRFFGHTDLSLVEVLVTLGSRSEVADYCSMFMEGKQGELGHWAGCACTGLSEGTQELNTFVLIPI